MRLRMNGLETLKLVLGDDGDGNHKVERNESWGHKNLAKKWTVKRNQKK